MVKKKEYCHCGFPQSTPPHDHNAQWKYEYRLVWQRDGCVKKIRRFAKYESAKRYSLLFGPTPWKYSKANPDDYIQFPDTESGHMGETYRERFEAQKEELPPIEYFLIERRKIGDWEVYDEGD